MKFRAPRLFGALGGGRLLRPRHAQLVQAMQVWRDDGAFLAFAPEIAPMPEVFVDAPEHLALQLGRGGELENGLEAGGAVLLVALDVDDPGFLILVGDA